jgi:nitrate/nitrite transport system substrate-binding protein
MTLEKTHLRLGIVPLCDCAPIVVAKERGFFAEQGLDVEIAREPSWANIRDKVVVGALDGAQMLATMPLATTLGLGNMRQPIITALGLNIGGNAITVSNDLFERMQAADPAAMAETPISARALKTVIEHDRAAGAPAMSFAMVYPFSPHNYELRAWMAASGIDPDRDVRLAVIPPPQMVANLSAGNIVGYCVGEPWNGMAASLGIGHRLVTSQQLWGGRVEKVLGVSEGWADAHPETHKALIRALLLACRWADQPENRSDVARLIAQPAYVNAPVEVIRAILEKAGAMIFSAHAANFPWRSQALWFLVQMRRWSQLPATLDIRRIADRVFRADLYRLAALELDFAVPLVDAKVEGDHPAPWSLTEATRPIAMGPDAFFDGGRFDPFDAESLAERYARHPLSTAPSGPTDIAPIQRRTDR